jgi:hypothetical protein
MNAIRILPLLLLIGCVDSHRTPPSRRSATNTRVINVGQTDHIADQPDQFPTDVKGEWVPASRLGADIVTLMDARFETIQPLPEEGCVPEAEKGSELFIGINH